jgi:hypothetical protein
MPKGKGRISNKCRGGYMDIKLNIIKDSNRGFIVKRLDGEYSQHAHVSTINGARQLINLIDRGLLPTSKYLQGSCSRLLTNDEYRSLKQKKQRYVNVNKGVR